MKHYCLCCKHCPDRWEYDEHIRGYVGKCKESQHEVYADEIYIEHQEGCYYIPRPEPELSHCKAVLKMLGVEVGE